MVISKLGTGDYAGLTGFAWPAGDNPTLFNVNDVKRSRATPIPFSDTNIIFDSGSENTGIGLTGELFAEADFDNLRKQIKLTSLDSVGEIIDFNQRLYLNSSTRFRWVRGQSFTDRRTVQLPASFPYTCTLVGVHPFVYHDGAEANASNTVADASPVVVSGAGIDNDGTAYVFPYFEVVNEGTNNITQITVSDGTNTITWAGALVTNTSIRFVQEYNPDLGLDDWTAYIYPNTGHSGTPTSDGFTGNKIFFDGGDSGNSITFTLTGNGGGGSPSTVRVKFRERDY